MILIYSQSCYKSLEYISYKQFDWVWFKIPTNQNPDSKIPTDKNRDRIKTPKELKSRQIKIPTFHYHEIV